MILSLIFIMIIMSIWISYLQQRLSEERMVNINYKSKIKELRKDIERLSHQKNN